MQLLIRKIEIIKTDKHPLPMIQNGGSQ